MQKYMKKVIFILLSFSLFNTVFAQNRSKSLNDYVGAGKFNITKSGVTLKHEQRIVCTDSKKVFYIGFLNDSIILENDTIRLDKETIEKNNTAILKDCILNDSTTKLKDLIILKPTHELSRIEIKGLIEPLDTTKKIFVQNRSRNGGAFSEAQYMAPPSNKGAEEDYFVIIRREHLPLELILKNEDTIRVEAFNSYDEKQCELVRRKSTAYKKLPKCDTIAISKDSLKEYVLPVLNLIGSNSDWKLEYNYYVNGIKCRLDTISDGAVNVMLPDEVCSKSAADDTLTISYTVKCFHTDKYLNHIRKGELVKIIVKPSEGLPLWARIFIFFGVVVFAFIVFFIIKKSKRLKKLFNKICKKLNKHHQKKPRKGEDESKDESKDAHEQPEDESLKANDRTDADDADNVLNGFNEFVPDLDKLDTDEKKVEAIKNALADSKKAVECLAELGKELELFDNDLNKDQLINKVKELKESLTQKEEELKNSPEKSYANVISWMKEKKNKTITQLIEKADNECSNVRKDTCKKDVLEKLIYLLALNLKDESSTLKGSSDITDDQMNRVENRIKMLDWMIKQLENKGYKGLRRGATVDTTFKTLADSLSKADNVKEPSEIIDDAVNNDKLSSEHKDILVGRLIKSLNSHITDDSALIETSLSLDKFITMISEKLQTPASFEDAQEAVRRNNINAVNNIFESDIANFDEQSLQNALNSAIVKYLNKNLQGFTADSLDAANKELTDALKNSGILADTLREHKVASIEKLPDEIREKYSKGIINSVNERVAKFFPEERFEKVQSLVNSLLKYSESAKNNEELIIDALEEQISLRNKDFVSQNCKDVIKLFDEYNSIVKSKENNLEEKINEQVKDIEVLKSNISSKVEDLKVLSEKNNTLMDESSKMVEVLHNAGETIKDACKTILNPCSDYDESLCLDIEDRLFGELSNMADRFNTFSLSIDCIPVDARKSIQQILVDEILAENSPVNTVCRYYAYSRLPFMTDTSREYGITFKRKNMMELYKAVETLYGRFGITLNIPDLFVAGFEEGNFENVTGQTYGDLDNLCQNSRNHFDNIDSNVKPSNIIVDVVNIGYAVDGKVERLASVLTY